MDMIAKKVAANLEGSEGMPIGIQIACRCNEEEKCLGIMKVVDNVLKN